MLFRSTLRRGNWLARSMRAGVAWFALLVLALPGFASVRAVCCEPEMAKGSDCCAAQLKPSTMKTAAMAMPGMDSSRMAAMTGAAVVADSAIAITATDCGPASDSEVPAFVVRSEGAFDGSPLLTREIHSVLALNLGWGYLLLLLLLCSLLRKLLRGFFCSIHCLLY